MDIAALLLWMITAGVGVYLLMATIIARRARVRPRGAASPPVAAPATAPARAGGAAEHGTPAASTASGGPAASTASGGPAASTASATATAARVTAPRVPPPIPHVRVVAGPEEHPLLEFSHPALAITGLGTWLAYVATRFAPFAWFSFTLLVIAIVAGLTWLATGTRARKRRGGGHKGPGVSHRLVLLHGLTAGITFALAALTVLALAHV